MFYKTKKRTLWILFGISVVLSCLSVVISSKINVKNLGLVIMMVCFLTSSFLFQAAISKTIKPKQRPINYNVKTYKLDSFDELERRLRANNFNSKKTSFGVGFIKIENNLAYKVLLIKDTDKYFNQTEEDKKPKPTKGIDECKAFIGFEIFLSLNELLSTKIVDFSFQGDKVFYEGLYYDEDNKLLIEPNAQKPLDKHIDMLNNMLNFLNLEEVIEEDKSI